MKTKELIKQAKKSLKLKGRIKESEIQLEDVVVDCYIKFKTKDELNDYMAYVRSIASITNFGYRWGENMAYAIVKNNEHCIHFDAPEAKNTDNNYWAYPNDFGFYIRLNIS